MRYIRSLALLAAFIFAFPIPEIAVAVPLTTQPNIITMTLTNCSTTGVPIIGNGSGSAPSCGTTSGLLDLLGSARGDIAYRGASGWAVLAPGTNGFFLETQGAGADPIWAAAAGGSGCTIAGGAQFQIIVNNGASGCSSSPNATVNVGALALGASGTLGSVQMGNATSGTVKVQPITGALGSVTASLPANTGTIAELNLGQTWTAAQTFTNSDILILGSSTGATTLTSANAGGSNFTLTLPAVTDTVSVLGTAQTHTALQTYNNSDIAMLGSSTGKTTLTSANAGVSNFTLTMPAVTDTLAVLGTAQTFTAAQTFTNSDLILKGSSTGTTTFTSANAGASNFTLTVPANTGTLAELNLAQTWTAAQAFNNADLVMNGSSSGTTTLEATAAAGTTVATFPANTGTVAELNLAQTFSALQTFNNSDIAMVGSSTGATTLTSANAGASNFTLTLPAVTDTLATLGTAGQAMTGGVILTPHDYGTVSSGTTTVDCSQNPAGKLTNNGAFTLAAPSNDGQCIVLITNGASAGAITFSGFTVGSNTGAALDTTNAHKFSIFVFRTNGVSAYSAYAHQ
jgi:hypothetical protein